MIKILNSDGFFNKIKAWFYNNSSNTELNSSINDEKIIATTDDTIVANTNDDIDLFIQNTTTDIINLSNPGSESCFQILGAGDNYYTTGKRRLLFKVEKNKFNYPAPKSTTLFYYPNLPILESLESTESIIVKNTTTTIICNGVNVDVPIAIEYKMVNFKPYVSYSVALYAKKIVENLPGACDFDINNLDIYALEEDSLFLIPFEICFPKDVPKFDPSQFLVTINVTNPTDGTVTPVCEFEDYYLYELQVEIKLELAPAINLNTINQDTLDILNTYLNKIPGNTLFTKLELDSFTEVNFSNLINLDYNIFEYLPNLVNLNISNTNAQADDNISKLSILTNLQTLIARNNNFTDLSQFLNLTNLIATLKILDIGNDSTAPDIFSIKSSLDISPLSIFTKLTTLNLSNTNISNIPPNFTELSNLVNLDLSYNNISNLSEVSILTTLTTLNLSYNNITEIPESISNLQNLTSLNLDANEIVDMSNLSTLNNLKELNINGNPLDPSTTPDIPTLTILDLSNTNLDNSALANLNISSNLQTLIISNNAISDLTPLFIYNLELIADNQIINYGTLYPIYESSSNDFFLELDFLVDVNYSIPCVDFISNDGVCYDGESCECLIIVWENITEITDVYFEFSNINQNFSGIVNIQLNPSLPSI